MLCGLSVNTFRLFYSYFSVNVPIPVIFSQAQKKEYLTDLYAKQTDVNRQGKASIHCTLYKDSQDMYR